MSTSRQCSFYRDSDSGSRYCDLDGSQTTCNGDLNSCEDVKIPEQSDDLMQHLQEKLDECEIAEDKGE
jgi:hypothetical protein